MRDAIQQRRPGILTYGITPPKRSYSAQKRAEVASRQTQRINQLPVDGLVVYDIQDESDRTDQDRPFPYIEALDPIEYALDDLAGVKFPKVMYRCVGPHSEQSLRSGMKRVNEAEGMNVFVGAASTRQQNQTRLSRAYDLHGQHAPTLPLGGVLIAERHESRGGEEQRVFRKMDAGCSFFITQAVYSVVATKNVLSDLHYGAQQRGIDLPPVLVTLSPCGSPKTLDFMRWLGISVPRWLANELSHAQDTLELSVDLCCEILKDLLRFARPKGIPLGCNVESVSLRRAEIEASVELVHRAKKILES